MTKSTNSQAAIAYETIRDQIVTYVLKPDAILSDNQLSKELGMSRAPVREALLLLKMDGLVQANIDRKLIVAPIHMQDIADILHVRCALEVEAILLIAQSGWLTPQQEQTLIDLQRQMAASINDDSVSNHYRYDDAFHQRIAEYSGNTRICEILMRMHLQMQRARWLNIAIPSRHQKATEEHQKLLDAIISHDCDNAVAFVRIHLSNSEKAFLEILRDKKLQMLASMINSVCASH